MTAASHLWAALAMPICAPPAAAEQHGQSGAERGRAVVTRKMEPKFSSIEVRDAKGAALQDGAVSGDSTPTPPDCVSRSSRCRRDLQGYLACSFGRHPTARTVASPSASALERAARHVTSPRQT